MPAHRLVILPSMLFFAIAACEDEEAKARIAELEAELESNKAAETERATQQKADQAKAEADLAAKHQAELAAQEEKIVELETSKGNLEGKLEQTQDKLEQKQEALEAAKVLQDALAKSLVEEVETGDISISERGGLLVVDVSDTVLFAIGEAELSERGIKVLTNLAESLKALPGKPVFQVGGHTDNQPIKSEEVKAKFPTNWELSATRATNVVRFLEETAKIPGERLVAAGFSQYRPVASNAKPKGRAKNRRIEIALMPPK